MDELFTESAKAVLAIAQEEGSIFVTNPSVLSIYY